jgi:ELWxxDGT repeat protein
VSSPSISSISRFAGIEPLEQRRLLAVSQILDLTNDPFSSGRPAFDFAVSNGIGFFTRWGTGSIGSLWTTDGFTATRVGPGPPGTFRDIIPVKAGVVGLRDGGLSTVFRSDGTAAGTYVLGEVDGVHTTLGNNLALRGRFYINDDNFNAGIYETDGNTLVFRGRVLGAWGNGAEYSDGIVFNTFVHPDRHGLYTLDSAGVLTQFIEFSTLGGYAHGLENVRAGITFLVRKDLDNSNEYSLWRTDGTAENTAQLPVSFGKTQWVEVAGSDKQRAMIRALDQKGRWSLWSTDGTANGTRVIQQRLKGDRVTMIGNTAGHTLFVVRETGSNVGTLWATKGTPGSTHRLAELDPYPGHPGAVWPERSDLTMHTTNSVTYFINTDRKHGWEIWRTDGTRKGTRLAFDLVPGPGSAEPVLNGIVGERLIINATLEGHRGLFAVDLNPQATPAPPPTEGSRALFSSKLLSTRAQDERADPLVMEPGDGKARFSELGALGLAPILL